MDSIDKTTEEVRRCPRCGRKLQYLEFKGNHYLSCKCGYAFDLDLQRDVTSEVSGEEEKEEKKKKQEEIYVPFWRQGDQCFEAVFFNGQEKFITFQFGEYVCLDSVQDLKTNRIVYPSDPMPHPYYISNEDLENIPDITTLYDEVLHFFEDYFAHTDARVKKFLALYVIHSYILPLSPGVISIWLVGPIRSGKSTVQRIFDLLAYRPFGGVGISEAAIYRRLGHDVEFGPTVLIKEYERASNLMKEIFREADVPGSTVDRVDKVNEAFKPNSYYVFSSKIVGSNTIHGNEADLDRYIVIKCIRMKPKRPRSELERKTEVIDAANKLRNLLLLWKVQNFSTIKIPFEDPQGEFEGRDYEHFAGIITIAGMISRELEDELRSYIKEYLSQTFEDQKSSIIGVLRDIIMSCKEEVNSVFRIASSKIWLELQKVCEPVYSGASEVPNKLTTPDGRVISRTFVGKLVSEQLNGAKALWRERNTVVRGFIWDKETFNAVFAPTDTKDTNVTSVTGVTGFVGINEDTKKKEDVENTIKSGEDAKIVKEEPDIGERSTSSRESTSTSTSLEPVTLVTPVTKEGWEGNETHMRSVTSVTSVTENNYAQPEPLCPPGYTTEEWSKLSLEEKERVLEGQAPQKIEKNEKMLAIGGAFWEIVADVQEQGIMTKEGLTEKLCERCIISKEAAEKFIDLAISQGELIAEGGKLRTKDSIDDIRSRIIRIEKPWTKQGRDAGNERNM